MEKTIYMGEMAVAKEGILRTTLGSCVGIVLYDPRQNVYGLAHVMLPQCSEGEAENPGKYANTAIPALLKMMNVRRDQYPNIVAKIAGGSNMFANVSSNSPIAIGVKNIEAVKTILKDLQICIRKEDLGGEKGRQLIIDVTNKKVTTNCIGAEPKEL